MVNTYQIVLGTTSMEITPEDVAFNATELIPKDHIAGVFPMTFEQRQVGNADWTYPYNTITRVTIYLRNGRKLECELQSINNQPTWNGGTLADLQQAIADINPWLQGSVIPSPYILAYNAYISEQTGTPTQQYLDAWKDIFNDLFNYGVNNFNLHDVIYLLGGYDETDSRINLINPSGAKALKISTPTWGQGIGYSGFSTTKYISANYIPSINGLQYLQNDACIWAVRTSGAQSTGVIIGCSDSANFAQIYPRYTDNYTYVNANDSAGLAYLTAPFDPGIVCVKRTDANTLEYWVNDTLVSSATVSSTAIVTVNMTIGARNYNGTIDEAYAHGVRAIGIGSGQIDVPDLYHSAMQKYFNQIDIEKRVLVFEFGQSNIYENELSAGVLTAPQLAPLVDVYSTGYYSDGIYPYQAGVNSIYGATGGTKFAGSATMAYKLANTYSKKLVIGNAAVNNTCIAYPQVSGSSGSWNVNDPSSLLFNALNNIWIPMLKRSNSRGKILIKIGNGENDSMELAASTNYFQNMKDIINYIYAALTAELIDLSQVVILIRKVNTGMNPATHPYVSNVNTGINSLASYFQNMVVHTPTQTLGPDQIHYKTTQLALLGEAEADTINTYI